MHVSSFIAAIGFLIGALATTPWLAICGFAISGFGVANIVPVAFSAAGKQPGIMSSTGMSIVTSIGYSGTLVAPVLIGTVAGSIGLSNVFRLLAAMPIMIFILAPLMGGEGQRERPQ